MLPSLESLDVSNNKLAGLEDVLKFTQLKTLRMVDNRSLPPDYRYTVAMALPELLSLDGIGASVLRQEGRKQTLRSRVPMAQLLVARRPPSSALRLLVRLAGLLQRASALNPCLQLC